MFEHGTSPMVQWRTDTQITGNNWVIKHKSWYCVQELIQSRIPCYYQVQVSGWPVPLSSQSHFCVTNKSDLKFPSHNILPYLPPPDRPWLYPAIALLFLFSHLLPISFAVTAHLNVTLQQLWRCSYATQSSSRPRQALCGWTDEDGGGWSLWQT